MKISVAVTTYNQEITIIQTIDSILMQKGDFDLELIIGEDCSSDKTLSICREYEQKYPNVVKVVSGPHNLGIMANYARTIRLCTGDYIADIAGDDYYIDEYALQKQMMYMQEKPEVGVMGANGYMFFVKSNKFVNKLNDTVVSIEHDNAKEFYFSSDYRGGVYFRPVGMMIRKSLLDKVDFEEFIRRKLPVEDYPMQAVLSQRTHFACLPDLLVTYRIYKQSATFLSFDSPHYIEYHRGLMNIRRYLNEMFPNDACVNEETMQDYEFYKEFLLYLHNLQYSKAKMLLSVAEKTKAYNQPHYLQAKKMMTNKIKFFIFYIYKEIMYYIDIKKRTE